ncbi:hypothetical protein Nepgr_022793 [Nepenthes gracilis]|uniref:Uncharacterized protein n=1 Tax=Nepenthes gracilis TaxID=150966 RepID=A0AAD3T1L7_NEPGR|nr:hypothetical protein Nepgr_022793 [Nepenthes gracilis]
MQATPGQFTCCASGSSFSVGQSGNCLVNKNQASPRSSDDTIWRQPANCLCTTIAQQPFHNQQKKGTLASNIPAPTQCHTAATAVVI